MRARARGSRPIAFGVGSTTVRPPACLNSEISSWATCSSRSRKLSRLALKFWRTQPRLARLTGSHARSLSPAAAGSANITLKSIKRCSCGSVMPIASLAIAPSTVWIWPPSGRGIPLAELGRDLRDEPVEVAAQLVERAEHARDEGRVDPRGLELTQLLADLVRRAGQAGVARVRGVTAHALGDGVGEPLDVLFLVGDEQRHVGRAPERLRVTADGGAVLVEDLSLPPQDTGTAPAVPMVGVLGHDAQGDALPAAADHQLGVRRLHGLGIERGVGELVVVSLERCTLLGPQRAHHLARFVEPLEPLAHRVERDPVRLVLVLLPAGAEPQQEPTARDDVDLRGHLRDERGVAIRVAQHDGADAHARHQRRQRRQGAPRLKHGALALLRVRHEVVGHARDVPLRRLQVAPEVQHACPGLGAHARENTETHVDLLLDFAGPCPASTPILTRPLPTIAGGVGPGGLGARRGPYQVTVRAFYNVSLSQ